MMGRGMSALRQRAGRALTRAAPRVADAGALHQAFLVSAVATVLVIRTQLWLTNYPQLGGGGLHIAHLLWGGLWMVVAIALLLTFAGRAVRTPAAIIGGVGFGFFIDELGKFITEDNNYFYKPAAALIYLIFVCLFLLARAWQRHSALTPPEQLASALELVAGSVRRPLTAGERREALARLHRAGDDPLATALRQAILQMEVADPHVARPPWVQRVRAAWRRATADPRFNTILTAVFGAWAVLTLVAAAMLVLSLGLELGHAHAGFASDRLEDLSFVNVASLCSSLVSAVLVGLGVLRLRRGDRRGAYVRFENALLISIFITQTFAFVESQFGAVFGAGISILMLATLRRLAATESPGPEDLPAGRRAPRAVGSP